MSFKFEHLAIPDVIFVNSEQYLDERGMFMELYKYSEFRKRGIKDNFVQENLSRSEYGVLRGLHYQLNPDAQAKLVRVLNGKIFDVAVDLRAGSQFYGRWVGKELDANNQFLYIPVGFAHGFQALTSNAEVYYKVSKEYSPGLERGIVWSDQTLGIQWPIANPIVSDKDSALPDFEAAEKDFTKSG